MNIRKATVDDIPNIAECAREFCKVLEWPLNEEHYLGFIRLALEKGIGAVFLLEHEGQIVGGIGGTLQPENISGRAVAVELFWYILPEFRRGMGAIRLLQAFERWGLGNGACNICMIAMEKSMPEEMDGLYRRMGYRKLETTYIK